MASSFKVMQLHKHNEWLATWENTERLGDIPTEELIRVTACQESLAMLALRIAAYRDEAYEEFTAEEVMERIVSIRVVITLERVRRRWAHDRVQLNVLADRTFIELDQAVEIVPREFLRGFAMRIRERTGTELSDAEAAEWIRDMGREDGEENAN